MRWDKLVSSLAVMEDCARASQALMKSGLKAHVRLPLLEDDEEMKHLFHLVFYACSFPKASPFMLAGVIAPLPGRKPSVWLVEASWTKCL